MHSWIYTCTIWRSIFQSKYLGNSRNKYWSTSKNELITTFRVCQLELGLKKKPNREDKKLKVFEENESIIIRKNATKTIKGSTSYWSFCKLVEITHADQ